jgi:hypothetical protein
LPAAHDGPWPHVLASACPHTRGNTAVAWSLPTTRSTCSRRSCTPPCALSSRSRGPKEKRISFHSLIAATELLPLHSISGRPPLLHASSTTARSHRYLLMRLCVIVEWGQLRPSQPPLGADRMPHDASCFLDGMGPAAVSHLRPRTEAISFPQALGTR